MCTPLRSSEEQAKLVKRRRTTVFRDRELAELLQDDPALLAIADAIAESAIEGRPRMSRRRLVVAVAAVIALAVSLPAVAAFTPLIDFSSAPKAERPDLRRFEELERQAPTGMEPGTIADQTRRLEIPLSDGGTAVVLLAPTRRGGYCYEIVGRAAGCDRDRSIPITIGFAAPRGGRGPAIVYGWVLDNGATSASIAGPRGTRQRVELVRVSRPIGASVFIASFSESEVAFPLRVQISTASGEAVATRLIHGPPR